jgi:UDP-glucose 4-epimerase
MVRDELSGKNVLVTGGAGFIGSHLVDKLQEIGASSVVIIDNMFLGDENNITEAIEKGAIFYKEDAEFKDALIYIFEKHNIDVVFNCATKALNYSFINPANAFVTNVNVVINLLELLRKNAFKTLCHFSTSEVYGTAIYEPMDELHPKNPTTTYAAGKAAADHAVESYVKMFGVDAFILRPFNNYGPRQNFRGLLAGIIPISVMRILNGEKPEIHGTGEQTRDFIYVKDTIDAIIKLYRLMPKGESINISTDNCLSVKEVIYKICKHMQYTGEVLTKTARGSDVYCHNASNKKMMDLIGLQLTDFDVGLEETIDTYVKLREKK